MTTEVYDIPKNFKGFLNSLCDAAYFTDVKIKDYDLKNQKVSICTTAGGHLMLKDKFKSL